MTERSDNSTNDDDVSRTYAELNRCDSLESPVALDAAILAEAHRAVQAKPVSARSPMQRWSAPFAMAATVVITAMLVVTMPQREGEILSPPLQTKGKSVPTNNLPLKKEAHTTSTAAVAQESFQEIPKQSLSTMSSPAISSSVIQPSQARAAKELLEEDAGSDVPGAISAADARLFSQSVEAGIEELKLSESADAEEQVQALEPQSPEEWREKIEKLLINRNWKEADEQFELFKIQYPDHAYIQEFLDERTTRED